MRKPDLYLQNMAKATHPSDQPAIRDRLKRLITEKFSNQGELAAAAGIQPAAMSRILNGGSDVSKKQLQEIELASRARLDWLLFGTEPMFHPGSWVPIRQQPIKEGEYFRQFMMERKKQVSQTQLSDQIGVKKSVITDYFKSTMFDQQTRLAILEGLRKLTNDPTLMDEQVFGPASQDQTINPQARLVRHVGNFSAEPISVLPFVPIRARAGLATPQYWEHPFETTRVMQVVLADFEADPSKPRRSWWVIEVDGDSMEPQLRSRGRVLGYYIGREDERGIFRLDKEQLLHLRPGIWAIQYDDEFVIKRIRTNHLEQEGGLTAHSDNPPPDPFYIRADSIRHVWFIETVVNSPVR